MLTPRSPSKPRFYLEYSQLYSVSACLLPLSSLYSRSSFPFSALLDVTLEQCQTKEHREGSWAGTGDASSDSLECGKNRSMSS